MVKKFCIICGKEKDLIEGFCKECFKEKNSLLKKIKEINVIICSECKNYLYNNYWKKALSIDLKKNIKKIITKILKKKIVLNHNFELAGLSVGFDIPNEINISSGSVLNLDVKITVFCYFKDIKLRDNYTLPIKVKFSICNNCKKLRGNYYEAVLQIRPKDENVMSFIRKYCDDKKNNILISSIKEEKHGYDIYLTDQKKARDFGRILKKNFNGELKESKKLFGKKDGKDIYRGTVLFRIISKDL